MLDNIFFAAYFIALLLSIVAVFKERNNLSSGDKWIACLLIATLLFEIWAKAAARIYHNNMPLFHVWSPLQLLLICLYFNGKIASLKKHHIGEIIAGVGIIIAVLNGVFLQKIDSINSIFLLYEGFVVIGLCLFSFYELVRKDEAVINNAHFWLTTILLIYWSVVFVFWGMYYLIITALSSYHIVIMTVIRTVNIIAYCSIAAVYFNYRKLVSNG